MLVGWRRYFRDLRKMYNKVAQRKMLFEQATQNNLRQQVRAPIHAQERLTGRLPPPPPPASAPCPHAWIVVLVRSSRSSTKRWSTRVWATWRTDMTAGSLRAGRPGGEGALEQQTRDYFRARCHQHLPAGDSQSTTHMGWSSRSVVGGQPVSLRTASLETALATARCGCSSQGSSMWCCAPPPETSPGESGA
jgi:hypothetical protein